MKQYSRLLLSLLIVIGGALSGCQKIVQGPEPLPEVKIGVATFSQPTETWQLLAGYIPAGQTKLSGKKLHELDVAFEQLLLRETNRVYTNSGASIRCRELASEKFEEKPGTSLAFWSEVGRCMKVDLLVVPQIIDWQSRSGGEAGTLIPASVTMDTFIIDVRAGRAHRSHFEETQQSLSENLFTFKKWAARKGKWITAAQLAEEGMRKAITELGL